MAMSPSLGGLTCCRAGAGSRRWLLSSVGLAFVLVPMGCGNGPEPTSTTVEPTATTAEPTATTATEPTATEPISTAPSTTMTTVAPTTLPEIDGDFSASFPPDWPDDRAVGAGCSPGSEDLPDGIWFGFITSATPTGISFDLACIYSAVAVEAVGLVPPDEGYEGYIQNDSPELRELVAAPATRWWRLASGEQFGDPTAPPCTPSSHAPWLCRASGPDEFLTAPFDTGWPAFVHVRGGVLVEVAEVFLS